MENNDDAIESPQEPISRSKILNDWFDNKFLAIYQNPSKVEAARRLVQRFQPSDEVLEEILAWVSEDNRRRSRSKEFYPNPPNCYTFFHESRWMDKFKSLTENFRPETQANQPVCQCGKVAAIKINTEWLCSYHYSHKFCANGPTGINALREAYKRRTTQNPGEHPHDYVARAFGGPKRRKKEAPESLAPERNGDYSSNTIPDEDSWNHG